MTDNERALMLKMAEMLVVMTRTFNHNPSEIRELRDEVDRLLELVRSERP